MTDEKNEKPGSDITMQLSKRLTIPARWINRTEEGIRNGTIFNRPPIRVHNSRRAPPAAPSGAPRPPVS